jgi:hypothetical protein
MKDWVKEKLEVTVRGQRSYFWSDIVKKKLAIEINDPLSSFLPQTHTDNFRPFSWGPS